jgi:serpin B
MFDNLDSDIYVDKIFHKSFININEYGTEAAAATIINMNKLAVLTNDAEEFFINKHFKYLIRDNLNGEILFIGDCSNL